MAWSRGKKSRRVLLATSGALLVLVACAREPTTPPGPVLEVTVKDFKILPADPTVDDGRVTFRVSNEGPTTHEFVVVRTDLPADQLPIATDGMSVDEDLLTPLGELEKVEDGTVAELALPLSPGRYVLFCNLDGHYLGGMHASIEVPAHG